MAVTFENKGYLVLKKQSGTAYEAPLLTDAYIPLIDAEIPNPDYGIEAQGRPADGKFSPAIFTSGKLTGTTGGFSALFAKQDFTTPRVPHGLLLEMLGFAGTNTDPGGTDIFEYDWTREGNCSLVSAIGGNLGCGTGTSGFGIKLYNSKLTGGFGAESTGALVKFTGEMQGVLEAHGAQTAIKGNTPATLFNQAFDKYINATISMGGAAWKITSWSQDMGITLSQLEDPSAVNGAAAGTGVGQMYAVNFEPRLTITAQMLNGVEAIGSNIIADTGYSSLTIDTAFYQYSWTNLSFASNPTVESADGIIVRSMEFAHEDIKITSKV